MGGQINLPLLSYTLLRYSAKLNADEKQQNIKWLNLF